MTMNTLEQFHENFVANFHTFRLKVQESNLGFR